MKYMGSKARIAKHIMPLILKDRKEGQWYVEPFVGGANSFQYADLPALGADIDPLLILLLSAISNGWEPPKELSEVEYKRLKAEYMRGEEPSILHAYAAFNLSYGGMKWHTYRWDAKGKRNYADEAYRHLVKQQKLLIGKTFICCDYTKLQLPPNSIVYCDPPYQNTYTYDYSKGFDYNAFWSWVTVQALDGHQIFVSEYSAPDYMRCIWEGNIASSLTKNTGEKRATEKLFTL